MRAQMEWSAATSPEQWLDGLSGFSHVWLIGVFHDNLNKSAPNKIHPPRLNGASIGVLASRSPHRPNPISLTLARVIEVKGRELILSEVDLVDGTPILDIKPYIPDCDVANDAQSGWVAQNPWHHLEVFFNVAAIEGLERVYKLSAPPTALEQLKLLIQQSLSTDPRAVADRKEDDKVDGRPRWFWLRLYDLDIGFHYSPRGIEVTEARFALGTPLYDRFEKT